MGTITITEFSDAGTGDNPEQPVPQLKSLKTRTQDATTSTTAENITLQANTSVVRVYAAELHRVSLGSNNTGNGEAYLDIQATTETDIGVKGGETFYYRADA